MEAKMAVKENSPYIVKHSIVLSLKKEAKIIHLPTSWPSFLYEYDSPVIWFPQGPSEWNIDLSFANRSAVDQRGYILATVFHIESGQQPVISQPPLTCLSGQIVVDEWSVQTPSSSLGSGLWLRMFVTSRDLIPSLHVSAITQALNIPEFYFSPGDFAFFELPGGYMPPGLGLVNKP
jgi:hypothetical protein